MVERIIRFWHGGCKESVLERQRAIDSNHNVVMGEFPVILRLLDSSTATFSPSLQEILGMLCGQRAFVKRCISRKGYRENLVYPVEGEKE